MSNFIDNILPTIRKIEEIVGLSAKVFMVTASVVVLMGIYIANLIYGENSLHVVEKLEQEKEYLQQRIMLLKNENARLHKHYLEWVDAKE